MQEKTTQNLSTKKGEVEFRKNLALYQSGSMQHFLPDALSGEETLVLLKKRIEKSRSDFSSLRDSGVILQPYIEIGAERCQRSLLLENEFKSSGIAMDISFEILKFADVVAHELGYKKMPVRVACDVNDLPVRSDSTKFVFCYQTLHHFPDPSLITQQIQRVLSNRGVFFFAEEPVRPALAEHLRFYNRKGHKLNALEKLLNRLGILHIISTSGDFERSYDVLEMEFDLKTWEHTCDGFKEVAFEVSKIKLTRDPKALKNKLANLVGGNITGKCRIFKDAKESPKIENVIDMLTCPVCSCSPLEIIKSHGLYCTNCEIHYPEIDGIIFLFDPALGKELYPQIFMKK
jgi:uncharacterized protein YbaR (Trm112 family)/SAM-dependent methyltransferase